MANRYYRPGEERAEKVNDLFARIAPRYDLINDLQSFWMHRWWKRRLIRLAHPRAGDRGLDLCCGTGDVAFALAAQGVKVTGLDFSNAMLNVARKRAAHASPSSSPPEFIQGDAMATGLPDAAFDLVTMSYGLRNLANWESGLEEMRRVTKPGGQILILDFGKPDFQPWRQAYFCYLRWIVPRFGRLFFGDSDTHGYIYESLLNYPAQRGVEAKMHQMGFKQIRVVNLLGGIMSINIGKR
ncbi:MAG: bifunctional demethylmenaquinone methyltransferase/2-methoxy-6-polyprenyl-1,4-benzoquinol methylase UbiE [Verrucomicrobiales bacterium]|nr:bifunctional demethylmenaquinone methyltransferase/2-methoxy-6-polyprenyl-1,4-benzoquinol methylase UbiE [Verrucomicrobiales bacterium]